MKKAGCTAGAAASVMMMLVCAAGCGGSDCKPTEETLCFLGKVYSLDSCGNRADVLQVCLCGCDDTMTACRESCECTPRCDGKCGGPNGCGGICPGTCPAGQVCTDYSMYEDCCDPTCEGKCGGPNGCGGKCGNTCSAGQVCTADSNYEQCCTPACDGKCGGPDGCGGDCPDTCPAAQQCDPSSDYTSCTSSCQPDCTGKCGGPDGCGGDCPDTCQAGQSCDAGSGYTSCSAAPSCNASLGNGACGGDPTGSWNYREACGDAAVLIGQFCSSAEVQNQRYSASGTLTLSQDGTYQRFLTVTASVDFTVPASCYEPAPCSQFPNFLLQQYPGTTGQCSLAGSGCTCSLDIPWNTSDSGTWTTAGNVLQFFTANVFLSYYFCVESDGGTSYLGYSGTADNLDAAERMGYVLE